MSLNRYEPEDLERLKRNGFLTVGRLKEFLNRLPDDGLIFVERVPDVYFEGVDISGFAGCSFTEDGIFPEGSRGDGWKVLVKEGEQFQRALQFNEAIVDNEYEKDLKPISGEDLESLKTQYSPVWSFVRYSDDNKNLFLDLHY